MTKALLFDLDGTLLPMDTDKFVKYYLQSFAPKVAPYIEPQTFMNALLQGTGAMITNLDPQKTNEVVFEETFIALTNLDKESFWPVFDQFYEQVFPTLAHLSSPTPLAKQIVEEALDQGFQVAVATNPVFPKVAIHERLKWAGIDHIPFEIVTAFEESSFTKPHLQYYEMICNHLGLPPQECIMIGNDIQEDIVAGELGMKTFLVEGNVVDRGNPIYTVHDRGALEDLFQKLKNKQGLFVKS